MSRKKIAAGNWKMNTTVEEGLKLYGDLSDQQIPEDVTVIVGVPATHLQAISDNSIPKILVAAQNCHYKNSGAFTGETSPTTLVEMGIPYVILGHSERREYGFEDNAQLKDKLDAALSVGLNVIFCCGESFDIRKAGNQNEFVKSQLLESVFHISIAQLENIVIAYEPIWAIGTGETASPDQAQDMHQHIRSLFEDHYGRNAATDLSILYGGSVKPANAQELFEKSDVDGGLVGGASLDAVGFGKIIRSF